MRPLEASLYYIYSETSTLIVALGAEIRWPNLVLNFGLFDSFYTIIIMTSTIASVFS